MRTHTHASRCHTGPITVTVWQRPTTPLSIIKTHCVDEEHRLQSAVCVDALYIAGIGHVQNWASFFRFGPGVFERLGFRLFLQADLSVYEYHK
jgi:hypothetical protein